MIHKDILIQILREFEKAGIENIAEAIKSTDKNDLSFVCPQREIKFKGHSVMHDVINSKLRITDKKIPITELRKINYSKRFSKLTLHYKNDKKKEIGGDEQVFTLVNLTGDELFKVLNF